MSDTPELLIYCCPLPELDDVLLEHYSTLLNAEEQERLAGLCRDRVRRVFLASRALLRTTLAARFGCEPADLRFYRDHNGKPQLLEPATHWQFNLSHAGDWAVLALTNAGAVGVDVEVHERRNNLAGIARRFYTPQENIALQPLPESAWSRRFFELWTLKEAYVKALGRGIATALAGTDIEYADATSVRLHLSGAACCEGGVRCWHYRLSDTDSLAGAVIGRDDRLNALHPRLYRVLPLREQPAPLPLAPTLSGFAV